MEKKEVILNKRIEIIKDVLVNKKAENIEVIDLSKQDYVVDYVVIATTLNPKHGFALLNHLKTQLKPIGEEFIRVDETDDWSICDLGDMFINLMSESARKKYSLEEFLEDIKTK